MSEFEEFQQFFDRMGVAYGMKSDVVYYPKNAPAKTGGCEIAIGETFLHFSREGVFVGLLGQEQGYWEPRLEGK